MSTLSTYIIPVAVALVSGGFGSIITTYGAQTKDRRQARGDARVSLTKAEDAAARTGGLSAEEIAAVESSAFTAGIPSYLVEAYIDARKLAEKQRKILKEAQDALIKDPNEQTTERTRSAEALSADADLAASLVSALLLRSLWHPLLARLTRRHQCSQLSLVVADLDQESADQKLRTRNRRQSFISDHVSNQQRLRDEERKRLAEARKQRAAKASLPVGQPKLGTQAAGDDDGGSPK